MGFATTIRCKYKSPTGGFGTSAAITPDVDRIFIIAGLSAAAILFMLVFLNAIVRELRKDRVQRTHQSSKNSLTRVMLDRYPRKDRAA